MTTFEREHIIDLFENYGNTDLSNLGEHSVLFDRVVACLNNSECSEKLQPILRDVLSRMSIRTDDESLLGILKEYIGINLDFSVFEQGPFGLNIISQSVIETHKAVISLLSRNANVSNKTLGILSKMGYSEYRYGYINNGFFHYLSEYKEISTISNEVENASFINFQTIGICLLIFLCFIFLVLKHK